MAINMEQIFCKQFQQEKKNGKCNSQILYNSKIYIKTISSSSFSDITVDTFWPCNHTEIALNLEQKIKEGENYTATQRPNQTL